MPRRTSYRAGTPCWIDCLTTDPTGFAGFFGELFGWTLESEDGYRLIQGRTGLIGGCGRAPMGSGTSAWTVYYASAHLPDDLKTLSAHGFRVVMPAWRAAAGQLALVACTDTGVVAGLFHGAHDEGVVVTAEPGSWCGTVLYAAPEPTAGVTPELLSTLLTTEPDAATNPDAGAEPDAATEPEVTADPLLPQRFSGSGPAGWAPVFGVSSLPQTQRRAVAAGAEVVDADAAGQALLRDPWGALVGLRELAHA